MQLREFFLRFRLIDHTELLSAIDQLDREFGAGLLAGDSREYLSRLSRYAVVELCGWIEDEADDFCRRIASAYSFSDSDLEVVEAEIRNNWGFDYQRHFRKLVVAVVGNAGFCLLEELARQRNQALLSQFQNELRQLGTPRNKAAHSFMSASSFAFDRPGVTRGRADRVIAGFRLLEKCFDDLYFRFLQLKVLSGRPIKL